MQSITAWSKWSARVAHVPIILDVSRKIGAIAGLGLQGAYHWLVLLVPQMMCLLVKLRVPCGSPFNERKPGSFRRWPVSLTGY